MSHMFTILGHAAIAMGVLSTIWFVVSVVLRRNDVADIAWGSNAVFIVVVLLLWSETLSFPMMIVSALIMLWGVRLSLHIARRVARTTEDYRYAAWRMQWGKYWAVRSYFQIFLLQAVLLMVVLAPVFVVFAAQSARYEWSFAVAGVAIWMAGFLLESMADAQLARFVRNPEHRGQLMTSGLWRYSRHPNYAGEVLQWWGIGVIAFSVPFGWTGLLGPIAITLLILFVSGVPLAEARMKTKPGFEDYARKTSIFVPMPPRH